MVSLLITLNIFHNLCVSTGNFEHVNSSWKGTSVNHKIHKLCVEVHLINISTHGSIKNPLCHNKSNIHCRHKHTTQLKIVHIHSLNFFEASSKLFFYLTSHQSIKVFCNVNWLKKGRKGSIALVEDFPKNNDSLGKNATRTKKFRKFQAKRETKIWLPEKHLHHEFNLHLNKYCFLLLKRISFERNIRKKLCLPLIFFFP